MLTSVVLASVVLSSSQDLHCRADPRLIWDSTLSVIRRDATFPCSPRQLGHFTLIHDVDRPRPVDATIVLRDDALQPASSALRQHLLPFEKRSESRRLLIAERSSK